MKFIWLDTEKYIDQIPFLKDNYEIIDSIDPDVPTYEVKTHSDGVFSKLKVLENCGFLKIIKDANELESIEDILMMTKKVEKIKSTPMYLKVYFGDNTFIFSESELLGSTKFRKCLLREGKFIFISNKDWVSIVQNWLNISSEITEETDEEYLTDKVINYLLNCTIYDDIKKCVSRNALYYDENEKGVVYCYIDFLMESINNKKNKEEITSRKIRAYLSEYIDGNSVQKRVYNNRYRFWKFKIECTGISLQDQLYINDKEFVEDENNKDIGKTRNGQDNLFS